MKAISLKLLLLLALIWAWQGCAPGSVDRYQEPTPYSYDHYVRQARDSERSGDVRAALDEWKQAKAVSPASSEAEKNITRLQGVASKQAEEAFQEGMEAWDRGNYKSARRSFSTALRLDPSRKEALSQFLEEPQRPEGVITHRIAAGESLSTIAKKYYGDPQEYKLLAAYNKIADPSKLQVGDEILIPGAGADEAASQPDGAATSATTETPKAETPAESPAVQGAPPNTSAYNAPQRLVGQDQVEYDYLQGLGSYQKKDYGSAYREFLKVVKADPTYKDALKYYKDSAYQNGRIMLQAGNPEAAYESLKGLSDIDPDYRDARNYLSSAEAQVKEIHYLKGIQLYKQEQLEEALQEWKIVYDLDPGYKKVSYYIERCEQVLKKIKELKSSDT